MMLVELVEELHYPQAHQNLWAFLVMKEGMYIVLEVYTQGGTSCNRYKGIFYSTDGLDSINLMTDVTLVHSNHEAITTCGQFYTLYDRILMTYACEWGVGSDSHLVYTDDNGESIENGGEIQSWTTKAHGICKANDDRIIYFTKETTDLWISDNDGLDFWKNTGTLPNKTPTYNTEPQYQQFVAANGSNLLACTYRTPWISTSIDNGDTWTTGSAIIRIDGDVFWNLSVKETLAFEGGFYCGGEPWADFHRGVVYTPDLGVSWYSRTGDLLTVSGCIGDDLKVYRFVKVGDTSISENENGLLTALDVGQQSATTVYIGSPDGIL